MLIRSLSCALLLMTSAAPVAAQAGEGAAPQLSLEASPAQELRLEVGQTRLIHLDTKVVRVSVADPDVADLQVVTPRQVLVTAKSVGFTHLIVWSEAEVPLVIAVSATRNLDQLRSQFAKLFPGEDIQVSAVGDLIVLSGTVSDLRLPARAAEVASLHSDRLANLIKVTGNQQVQLDVRFAEVSRSGLRDAGVNFLWRDTNRGNVGGLASAGGLPGTYLREGLQVPGTGFTPGPPLVPAPASPDSFNLMFSTGLSNFPFSAILSILRQEGLAKVLAEPTLVSLSGQEANFHAGGEVPILVPQGLGTVRVRFKKFGVKLRFTPTVLGERSLSLDIGVEVSEPDPSNGVSVTGFSVPGFRTRSSDTTVRLRDGQSFAIAGLLSDEVAHTVSKVPGLGDLPILGALFTSSAYMRKETELLMVVTAHLVQPLQPEDVPALPGEDEINDPSDFELFLFGNIEPDRIENFERRRAERRERLSGMAADANAPPPAEAKAPRAPEEPAAKPAEGAQSNAGAAATGVGVAARNGRSPLEGPLGPIGFMRR